MRAVSVPLRETFMVSPSYYTTYRLLFHPINLNTSVLLRYTPIAKDEVILKLCFLICVVLESNAVIFLTIQLLPDL